jgi:hypothetical protein
MARMEQIEASVGQDDPPTISFKLVDLEIGLVEGQDFLDTHVAIPLAGTLDRGVLSAPYEPGFREAETTPTGRGISRQAMEKNTVPAQCLCVERVCPGHSGPFKNRETPVSFALKCAMTGIAVQRKGI